MREGVVVEVRSAGAGVCEWAAVVLVTVGGSAEL